MESAILEVLRGLLPKPTYSISSVDEISFGELAESVSNLRAAQQGTFCERASSSSFIVIDETPSEIGESASESSSLQRETQGQYHSGSTRNKPFAASVASETGLTEEEKAFWKSYQQKLFEWLDSDNLTATMKYDEVPRENFLKWCGVTHIAETSPDDDISADNLSAERSRGEFSSPNNMNNAFLAETSSQRRGYLSKSHSKTPRFSPSIRQQPFDWKKFFTFSTKELNLFGITRKELQDMKSSSEQKELEDSRQASTQTDSLSVWDNDEERETEKTETWDDFQSIHDAVDRLLSDERFDSVLKKKQALANGEGSTKVTENNKGYAILDEQPVDNFEEEVKYPAKTFPFKLDDFQKRGILHLERGENVFVTAHTSAGKTVIAEYAIALAMQHQTRAIYTSPIKSLSNQKYRDFVNTFEDVGIVTGDVSIRPEASCLIMTTEILRSMLYKGADLIRDIEFVIFDEVHYINDEERGVVWEEVIIMLPSHIKLIMLSATVPNAIDFAKWVGATRKSKVFVVGTNLRPVPLQHCIFFRKQVYTLVNEKGKFMTGVYKQLKERAKKNLIPSSDLGTSGAHPWRELVSYLIENNLVPAVIFCFAKKRCDDLASVLRNVDLTVDSSEKFHINSFIEKSISRLRAEDRTIPQIERLREMLNRGIGIHHAGILPLMKEVVEILFQQGFVRILFATETFAMGVNMPAKTVVFSSIRKHDGRKFRWVQPGEYIQMAGRAGRRGIDSVGTVLLFLEEELPEMSILQRVMTGSPVNLLSQFRLSYNMILNLLRTEDLQVEDMIRHSFCEAPYTRDIRVMSMLLVKGEMKLKQLEERISQLQDRFCRLTAEDFRKFYNAYSEVERLTKFIAKSIFVHHRIVYNWLSLGRIVQVLGNDFSVHFAVVIGFSRKPSLKHKHNERLEGTKDINWMEGFCTLLSYVEHGRRKPDFAVKSQLGTKILSGKIERYEWLIENVSLDRIVAPISEKIHDLNVFHTFDARSPEFISQVSRIIDRLRLLQENRKFIPFVRISPNEDMMSFTTVDIWEAWNRRETLIEEIEKSPVHKSLRKFSAMKTLRLYDELDQKLSKIRWALSDDSLQLMPDYNVRIEVLKKLGFVNEEHVVQLKGRAACELNICDCVLGTEVIFENVLKPLDACECAAFLSSFVFEGSTKSAPSNVSQSLLDALETLRSIALRVGNLQNDCGLLITGEEYLQQNVKTGLVEVVYLWAHGVKFTDICEITEVPEGTIVRVINRISELLKEVKSFSRVVGDISLYDKIAEADERIRRDICFAASLYVT